MLQNVTGRSVGVKPQGASYVRQKEEENSDRGNGFR